MGTSLPETKKRQKCGQCKAGIVSIVRVKLVEEEDEEGARTGQRL